LYRGIARRWERVTLAHAKVATATIGHAYHGHHLLIEVRQTRALLRKPAVRGKQAHSCLSAFPRPFVRPNSGTRARRRSLHFVPGSPLIWQRMPPPPAGHRLRTTGPSPAAFDAPTTLHRQVR